MRPIISSSRAGRCSRPSKQILLIGWDFDTRICLDYDADDGAPAELGAFLSWLPKHRPGLQIHILKWDVGAIKLLGRGSTVFRLGLWASSKQIHFKLDGAHPSGGSHHHKIVVIDDALAFCGGIDMTGDRWDTRDHRDGDERRRRPTTRRRYQPWHDATMAVDGGAAAALGDLARERWRLAGGERDRAARGRLRSLARGARSALSRRRNRGGADTRRLRWAPSSARDRGALCRHDHDGEAVRLCREPIFRLARDRRSHRRTAGRAGRSRIRHRQSSRRARLAGRFGDEPGPLAASRRHPQMRYATAASESTAR